ncbi:urease accessory protein UreD [Priestia sp. SIMBA_032]|uniref:urease accessory protein UreD n=1 Tax=Priestia sp. SIMBA_032 TaxID=3085775 RepID=UPI00397C2038
MQDWTGTLLLTVENKRGKTVSSNVYFQGALKVMRPIYHDNFGKACYYILNPGGGYLDGDTYKLNITLKEYAQLTLTTQSATKVYKTPHKLAYQETEIFLDKGSHLEYIPDPLIAYEHARYKQKNIIHMDKEATLICSDILTPGWSPTGNQFSYDLLQLITKIYMDKELIVYDHLRLTPNDQKLDNIGSMEGFSHLGSMIVVGPKTNDELLDKLYKSIKGSSGDYEIGFSSLSVPGLSIRILSNSTQLIEEILTKCHNIINYEWFNTHVNFLRKY